MGVADNPRQAVEYDQGRGGEQNVLRSSLRVRQVQHILIAVDPSPPGREDLRLSGAGEDQELDGRERERPDVHRRLCILRARHLERAGLGRRERSAEPPQLLERAAPRPLVLAILLDAPRRIRAGGPYAPAFAHREGFGQDHDSAVGLDRCSLEPPMKSGDVVGGDGGDGDGAERRLQNSADQAPVLASRSRAELILDVVREKSVEQRAHGHGHARALPRSGWILAARDGGQDLPGLRARGLRRPRRAVRPDAIPALPPAAPPARRYLTTYTAPSPARRRTAKPRTSVSQSSTPGAIESTTRLVTLPVIGLQVRSRVWAP